MYRFIHDVQELYEFYDVIVPDLKDFEVLFTSLSCRKKYLSEEEREKYHITRAEMFYRQLVRKNEWQRFLKTIRKYETNLGSYVSKNGLPMPDHSLVIYFNINPSNSLKALKEFNSKLVDWQYEIVSGNKDSFKDKFNKLDIELMNCYQRNRGTKHWIDLDFDVPKDFNAPELMDEYLKSTSLRYYWIDTKSGYHLLLDRNTLKFNPADICARGLSLLTDHFIEKAENGESELFPIESKKDKVIVGQESKPYEIIVNMNAMIPLPGCYQGGHPVKVLWQYSDDKELQN